MNIYNIIPEELWIETLLFLNYRDLLRSSLVCESLNNLCTKNNIKDKIKYAGFPRKNNHCNVIELSKHNVKNDSLILNMLYNSNYELIRGDLIFFDDKICIFDGQKILQFIYNFEYEINCLPEEFTILNNNIPYDYWFKNEIYKGLIEKFAWFDISEVKDQCINNLRYDDAIDNPITSFNYYNNNYTLFYRFSARALTINDYKNLFDTTNLLLVEFNIGNNLCIVNM